MAAFPSFGLPAAHLDLERLSRRVRFTPKPVPRATLVPVAIGVLGLALWLAGHLVGSAAPARSLARSCAAG